MKILLFTLSLFFIFLSCKEDPITPDNDPIPTFHTFKGEIGINDNSSLISTDNSVLICGNSIDDQCILKLSESGSMIWRRDFSSGYGSTASGITQSIDHNIYLCGSTLRNASQSKSDILLVKTNPFGDTLWTKTYGSTGHDEGFYLINTFDGHLLICGITQNDTLGCFCDVYLVKVSLEGDTIWTKTYYTPYQESVYHLLQTQSGEYIITGTVDDSSQQELYLLKVDGNGNKIWDKKHGPAGRWGFSTAELTNGDLVTCGKLNKDGLSQMMVIRTDGQGDIIWEMDYGQTYLYEQGNSIQADSDGNLIVTGRSFEEHSGQRGIVLLKLKDNGEQLYLKDFGHSGFIDNGQNVLMVDNGDYIVTGQYNNNIFMTRTDPNGVFK